MLKNKIKIHQQQLANHILFDTLTITIIYKK